MAHADRTRDPCPWVILNDSGGAFSMGAIGGTIWHGIKGSRNSPRVSTHPSRMSGSRAHQKERGSIVIY